MNKRRSLLWGLLLFLFLVAPVARGGDDIPRAAWKRPIGAPLSHPGTRKPALPPNHIDGSGSKDRVGTRGFNPARERPASIPETSWGSIILDQRYKQNPQPGYSPYNSFQRNACFRRGQADSPWESAPRPPPAKERSITPRAARHSASDLRRSGKHRGRRQQTARTRAPADQNTSYR